MPLQAMWVHGNTVVPERTITAEPLGTDEPLTDIPGLGRPVGHPPEVGRRKAVQRMQHLGNSMKQTRKLFGAFRRASCTIALVLGTTTPLVAGTLGVCPQGSEGDHPFISSRRSLCMWVTNDHLNRPEPFQEVDYNIYCPGRMSQPIANRIGQEIVEGALIRNQGQEEVNPIVDQHRSAGLTAEFRSVPHRFEYDCFLGLDRAVATHIKVRVRGIPEGRPRNCGFRGSQNGDIALGARADREYKCTPPFHNSERGNVVWDEAARLVERDFLADLQRVGGKACILNGGPFGSENTDIQCAPCTYSDKLIVRLKTVAQADRCPGNTVRTVDYRIRTPDGGSENACFHAIEGKVAWNYSGEKRWNQQNVERLCRGTSKALEPGRCFQGVLFDGIDWGGGTRWKWENALDLCEGTSDAAGTIRCFQRWVGTGLHWTEAIARCDVR